MHNKDLGIMSGKLLIFGGAYGNLHALKRLKKIATENNFAPDQTIFTGDAAAYCAYPEACVQLLKRWGIHAMAGNVEIQLRKGSGGCGCNFESGTTCDRLSQQWYPYVQKNVSASSLEWMSRLPDTLSFSLNGYAIQFVHGSYTDVSRYIFKSTGWQVKQKEFETSGADIIIGGHCGLPFSDRQNGKLWFNTGAIGMPANEGTPRVWYATLETRNEGLLIQHHSMEYDYRQAAEAMKANNLPKEYWETLITGLWDKCDILPVQETARQEKKLHLTPLLWG